MTAYEDAEATVHGGRPLEVFKFEGSFSTYRYTSSLEDVVLGSNTYFAVPIKRRAVRVGTHAEATIDLVVEMPHDLPVVAAYAYTVAPPELELTVYRSHYGLDLDTEYVVAFTGSVSSFSITGNVAKVKVAGLFSALLGSSLPSVHYQLLCNHVVFDSRCTVLRSSYKKDTTIVAISTPTIIQVDDAGFASNILIGGEMVSDENGERRMISGHTDDTITISFPFSDINVGDGIELVVGCDHSIETCADKFSNTINYGGFPFIPDYNPFDGKL